VLHNIRCSPAFTIIGFHPLDGARKLRDSDTPGLSPLRLRLAPACIASSAVALFATRLGAATDIDSPGTRSDARARLVHRSGLREMRPALGTDRRPNIQMKDGNQCPVWLR